MKKFYLTLLLALVCVPAALAQFRWGVMAGFNYQKYNFKQDELMFPGIGFGMDFGLNYEMHGSRLHLGDQVVWASDGYGTEQSYIHLIQIPINLRFKYTRLNGVEQKIAPFVFGGPVFNIQCGHNSCRHRLVPSFFRNSRFPAVISGTSPMRPVHANSKISASTPPAGLSRLFISLNNRL